MIGEHAVWCLRQTLSEFGEDAMVVLYPVKTDRWRPRLGELLPHAFRGEFLDRWN